MPSAGETGMQLSPEIMLVLGFALVMACARRLFDSFKNNAIRVRRGSLIRREDHPKKFWTTIVVVSLLAVCGLGWIGAGVFYEFAQ